MTFGDFSSICGQSPIPLCAAVGPGGAGIPARCYARNIEVANTIIFQPASSVISIAALIMTVVMILHVRSKFTAVGRKEIITFFYIYMGLTFSTLLLDSGVVPPGSSSYPWFTALQAGLAAALAVCLLINGFVGFQLYEDGTTTSVWLLRISSCLMFLITAVVALATFKSWAGLSPTNTTGLFVILYIVPAVCFFIYAVSQIFLVTNTLQDRWPLAQIGFGALSLILGQVVLYVFSDKICDSAQHYIDGSFIANICNLLAVMMVYKFWDSITKEDLEFSVGHKVNNWEVKELLPAEDDRRTTMYQDADHSSMFQQQRARDSHHAGYQNY